MNRYGIESTRPYKLNEEKAEILIHLFREKSGLVVQYDWVTNPEFLEHLKDWDYTETYELFYEAFDVWHQFHEMKTPYSINSQRFKCEIDLRKADMRVDGTINLDVLERMKKIIKSNPDNRKAWQ